METHKLYQKFLLENQVYDHPLLLMLDDLTRKHRLQTLDRNRRLVALDLASPKHIECTQER